MHILIADDHDLFRDGIRLLLQKLADIVISEAHNREGINTQLQQTNQPDILLLDLDMPGVGSIAAVQEICTYAPKVAVIVMSGNDASNTIDACLSAGALGFLPKSSSTDDMLFAIRKVFSGETYIPEKLYDNNPSIITLSPRQKEIYTMLKMGNSNKEIAHLLDISESTVKQHITELFRKLSVSNRIQAIQKSFIIQ